MIWGSRCWNQADRGNGSGCGSLFSGRWHGEADGGQRKEAEEAGKLHCDDCKGMLMSKC